MTKVEDREQSLEEHQLVTLYFIISCSTRKSRVCTAGYDSFGLWLSWIWIDFPFFAYVL